MKSLAFLATAGLLTSLATASFAGDPPVKFKSTGEGDKTLETGYSPSDPLGNKPVSPSWDAGAPSTQAPYDDNCKEDRCIRAEQRQMGTTTWQQDRASGLNKGSGATTSGSSNPKKSKSDNTTVAPDTPLSSGKSSAPSSSVPPSDWKPE